HHNKSERACKARIFALPQPPVPAGLSSPKSASRIARLFGPKEVKGTFAAGATSGRIPPGPPLEFMRAQLAITYVVQKGKEAGVMLVPHRYRDGKYLASKCRQGPHFRVESTEELLGHMVNG